MVERSCTVRVDDVVCGAFRVREFAKSRLLGVDLHNLSGPSKPVLVAVTAVRDAESTFRTRADVHAANAHPPEFDAEPGSSQQRAVVLLENRRGEEWRERRSKNSEKNENWVPNTRCTTALRMSTECS